MRSDNRTLTDTSSPPVGAKRRSLAGPQADRSTVTHQLPDRDEPTFVGEDHSLHSVVRTQLYRGDRRGPSADLGRLTYHAAGGRHRDSRSCRSVSRRCGRLFSTRLGSWSALGWRCVWRQGYVERRNSADEIPSGKPRCCRGPVLGDVADTGGRIGHCAGACARWRSDPRHVGAGWAVPA